MSKQTVWRQLSVPGFCERLIGFSVPLDRCVLALSYEGAHLLRLVAPVQAVHIPQSSAYDIYDPESGCAELRGVRYSILGLHGGSPIVTSPQGERLELDIARHRLRVGCSGAPAVELPYENFSGDWVAATFSPDGRFIALGCPYDFDFRVWERTA